MEFSERVRCGRENADLGGNMTWNLLGVWGAWEYWLAPDGVNVSRRKVSSYNYLSADGSPVGARWDSTLVHFQTHVAGRLAI